MKKFEMPKIEIDEMLAIDVITTSECPDDIIACDLDGSCDNVTAFG